MAIRGNKGKPPYLKLVTGNAGKRAIQIPNAVERRQGPLKPHRKLTKAQAQLWEAFIDPAYWLTEFDAYKAWLWVSLAAQHDYDPESFGAMKLGQLRLLASELGLDLATRQKMGITTQQNEDPNDKYFGDRS